MFLFLFSFMVSIFNSNAGDISQGEYRLAAQEDSDVLGGRQTEVWAQIYYPKNQTQPAPLVLMLHGNHGTCGRGTNPRVDDSCAYTYSGTCPNGYVITPNHLGYSYLAEKLAAEGVIVVSVNANLGITCGGGTSGDYGLNLARGRLILKHLSLLSEWNKNGNNPAGVGISLKKKIDFSRVAMMGHSRGGEGVRAAFNIYHDFDSDWPKKIQDPVNFRAIFEIGPVDGQTSRELNAFDVAWNVLLPMCDGDVSDLQGMNPFDRMLLRNQEARPSSKSTLVVWGTNHNFYNTEWQESDSSECSHHDPLWTKKDGDALQRQTAEMTLIPFFKAKLLGEETPFINVFDPSQILPDEISKITRVDRNFVSTVSEKWEPVIDLESTDVASLKASQVKVKSLKIPEHSTKFKGLSLTWSQASDDTYFEIPLTNNGDSVDLSSVEAISFRLNRATQDKNNVNDAQSFSMALVDRLGVVSQAVESDRWVELPPLADHQFLMTLKAPVGVFVGAQDLSQIKSLRLIFNRTPSGVLLVAEPSLLYKNFKENLNTSIFDTPSVFTKPTIAEKPKQRPEKPSKEVPMEAKKQIIKSRFGKLTYWLEVKPNEQRSLVRNALPVLQMGDRKFKISRFPEDGSTDRLLFEIDDVSFFRSFRGKVKFSFEGSSDDVVYLGGVE